MNRKKKGNQKLKARVKKANAKLNLKNKPKYICKADREKLATESSEDAVIVPQS
ncbi:MAG: DUF2986 domain-containing protein [Bacteroidota bacterium]